MGIRTKFRSKSRLHLVSCCFTELLNRSGSTGGVQATIHELAKGAKRPLATHFFMNRFLKTLSIIALVLLLSTSVLASPLWRTQVAFDGVRLWFTPRSEKALVAAELANKRLDQIGDKSEDDKLIGVYAVQNLLSVIEENINMPGKPFKVLRKQQEVEEQLLEIQEKLKGEDAQSDEYKLVVKDALLRAQLLSEEVELAKKKTKVKTEQV